MTNDWSADDLDRIGSAEELQIGTERADGTLRPWVSIWVVRVGEQVFVRTWYRRNSGWFGHVLNSRRARIRVPGLEVDVSVADIGDNNNDLGAGLVAAYRAKYAHYGTMAVDRMVTDEAAATTLQLIPERDARSDGNR